MRFNKRITLVKEQEERYNPITGEMERDEPIETTIPANVTNLKLERKVELFGSVDLNIIVARTQRAIDGVFDYVIFNKKRYEIKAQSSYRKGILYLEGDSIAL